MSFYTKEQKQEIYRKWIENGRPWFSIDGKNDPTAEERSIILEIKKAENNNESVI